MRPEEVKEVTAQQPLEFQNIDPHSGLDEAKSLQVWCFGIFWSVPKIRGVTNIMLY